MEQEQFLDQILEYASKTGSFNSRNLIESASHVCIFGAGTMFHEAYETYFLKTGIQVRYLCDNDPEKWGKEYLGIRCISPSELKKLENPVVIPLVGRPEPIEEQLKKMKISAIRASRLAWDLVADTSQDRFWFQRNISNIKQVYQILEDARSKEVYVHVLCNRMTPELSRKPYAKLYDEGQYFGNLEEGYQLGRAERFCDVGAYIGDTIESFLEATNGNFEQIYAFEIEPNFYRKCCQKIDALEQRIKRKIRCFPYGALDEQKNVYMGWEAHGPADSNGILRAEHLELGDAEKQTGKTARLEDVLEGKSITLLKMDIEGTEQAALRGAKKLIQTEHPPKLAICIYHRLQDMWEIPLYLKKLVPEYRISIRHHSKEDFVDTVCYAYV